MYLNIHANKIQSWITFQFSSIFKPLVCYDASKLRPLSIKSFHGLWAGGCIGRIEDALHHHPHSDEPVPRCFIALGPSTSLVAWSQQPNTDPLLTVSNYSTDLWSNFIQSKKIWHTDLLPPPSFRAKWKCFIRQDKQCSIGFQIKPFSCLNLHMKLKLLVIQISIVYLALIKYRFRKAFF